MSISTAVSGTGAFKLGGGASLALHGAGAGQTIGFTAGGGTLALSKPITFAGIINGFTAGDSIDLVNTPETSWGFAGGILQVSSGRTKVAGLHFGGHYTTANFAVGGDGHGGTLITFH